MKTAMQFILSIIIGLLLGYAIAIVILLITDKPKQQTINYEQINIC